MVSEAEKRGSFTTAQAEELAERHFGIQAKASGLPSYADQNYMLSAEAGKAYVLKLANARASFSELDLENQAMLHLETALPQVTFPRVVHGLSGDHVVNIEDSLGRSRWMRLLTYVPGKVYARAAIHRPSLHLSLGQLVGQTCEALFHFRHPADSRHLDWDLSRLPTLRKDIVYMEDDTDRTLVEKHVGNFEREVSRRKDKLRHSVIHNDVNDHNILVDDDEQSPKAVCLIDFGDMVYTIAAADLAIACTYAMFHQRNPMETAARVVRGFCEQFSLTDGEMRVLYFLIMGRLCNSLIMSARQHRREPTNEYIRISERPARKLLRYLDTITPSEAKKAFEEKL